MGRWKLKIEFDGTSFSGWQKQDQVRTVQGELEKALTTFLREKIDVMGQGRTDSGVHAECQIAHADLPESVNAAKLIHAMNGLLPKDMAVIHSELVKDNFHARFHAISRRYRYQVAERPVPLHRHTHWVVTHQVNEKLMHECADMIRGEHDFVNFAKEDSAMDEYGTTKCKILESGWERRKPFWIYRIEGNRFLRHMVRRIVGTTIQVATGRVEMHQFEQLLSGRKVKRKGHSAPAVGLILEEVKY